MPLCLSRQWVLNNTTPLLYFFFEALTAGYQFCKGGLLTVKMYHFMPVENWRCNLPLFFKERWVTLSVWNHPQLMSGPTFGFFLAEESCEYYGLRCFIFGTKIFLIPSDVLVPQRCNAKNTCDTCFWRFCFSSKILNLFEKVHAWEYSAEMSVAELTLEIKCCRMNNCNKRSRKNIVSDEGWSCICCWRFTNMLLLW